ncbi:phage tail protein [Ulvibacter litoralis]|uniref:Phage tail protein n=1 Tax=Ulvibacter litoralis TaxID=227084 RepID=A0A1G7J382_9FLAO|nr:phage tail protein [Ulvibacter litoralis]GHC60659.1 hypothetical protein GCM10008083_27070 [Ulvibacter litoralis]SDF19333.1 hypothetical protein SAMN05421855_10866 [Ulvibacter litoralis]
MANKVNFKEVSTSGLEASPVKETLAGLRAHEARYFMNKYKLDFIVYPAKDSPDNINWVHNILKKERDIEIKNEPLETANLMIGNTKWIYVFYQNGLAINVLYPLDEPKKRAVGFKLSEGMEVPNELKSKFKFARQKSKLAGTIRGSFFVIKGEY